MKSIKIDFQKEKLGKYISARINKVWENPPRIKGVNRVSVVKLNNKKVLQIKFPKDKFGLEESGAQWKLKFKDKEEIYVKYKIFFPKGFNFVRGGKLPGLHGGSSPAGGENQKNATGFSARIMWRTHGFVENTTKNPHKAYLCQYLYYPKKDQHWGKDFNWELNGKKVYIETGIWHTIKTRIKLEEAGKENDLIESWFDGKKVLSIKLMLRDQGYKYGIDTFNFIGMFGGNENTWAPKKEEYILFDDFVISDKKIK
ncbi:hypothetical protein HN832_03875 [archaeon]|jgi:hypothetical protein|nr:hypothetical protein [archaeon]MBT4373467.1 hypothetical protein [archaeon]MBT4531915.1 hypothetical protein [archaeon]MBT7001582.1 hypothetical protein [archaeon]MBT7282526.1 hypothetical protein [archaeon]